MTGNATEALAQVPLRVTNPQYIPARRYHDPAFFELERERLWPRVWQMACRLEEIPEVGDYVEYRNLGKTVIVVRTKAGVKAYHNACRHRGVQLVDAPGNCRKSGFICPFHGWRWNMDGDNTFVFGRQIFSEDVLDQADLALVPCRVETGFGCAFINFDDNAPSLLDCMGPVAERMAPHDFEKLRMRWWYATELPTNWKLAMEAFMEGYHVMRTHPQLHERMIGSPFGEDVGMPLRTAPGSKVPEMMLDGLARLGAGMGGQVSEREVSVLQDMQDIDMPEDYGAAAGQFIGEFLAETTRRGQADVATFPDLPAMFGGTPPHGVEYMFPHFFFVPSFSAMSSYRVRPLTPETCLFEIWCLDYFKDGEVERPRKPIVLPYNSQDFPEIPRQDYSNLPRQQIGLHAGGFENMRLSNKYEGLISNYQRLIDGYLAGIDQNLLLKANRVVNMGYDAPIADIGF